jgi:hypothetical protein
MRRLRIDFAARGLRPRWPGRVLLALALALSADAALTYGRLASSLETQREKLARSEPAPAPARKAGPEELAAVRETVDRLSMPWERLFGALEAAASDEVALLGIQPDAKAGTVLISGDGKNYLATLGYVLNLERGNGLQRVQLVRHEVKDDDPRRAVSFAISAAWSEAKR